MSVILSFFLGFRLSSYINGRNKSEESSDKSKNNKKSSNNSIRNKINIIAITSFTMLLGIALYQLKNSNNNIDSSEYIDWDSCASLYDHGIFTQDQIDACSNLTILKF